MAKTIKALTLDLKVDGWEKSRGFVMRDVPMPVLDEKVNPEDALSVIFEDSICRAVRHRPRALESRGF